MYRQDYLRCRLDEGVVMFPGGRMVPVESMECSMNPSEYHEFHYRELLGRARHTDLSNCERVKNEIFISRLFLPSLYENPTIKKVIFNDPATIVIWSDNSKTVVKCQPGDTYSKELGLLICIAKKFFGNKGNFNNVLKKWIPEETPTTEDYFVSLGKSIGSTMASFKEGLVKGLGEFDKDRNAEVSDNISIEDMRQAIKNHCNENTCDDCVLVDQRHCYASGSDEEIKTNYNIIKKEI